tara:strand:+ start:2417 stop:3409 length:993 start_codon:yes stop_codon:yes gene_type:complete
MTTYKEAGVDIDLANKSINRIKKSVKSTFNNRVISDLGAFGGCYLFPKEDYKEPVLVSSTDGVGTKLKIAFLSNRHDTIGQCIVNHCVNDILVLGAKPLFFLDYFATGKLIPDVFEDVVGGMTVACKENKCALIAGETAEMPGFYGENEYDLSGTIVGVSEKNKLMSSKKIEKGNLLLGLHSNGLHTNGYSLARKVLLEKFTIDTHFDELDGTIGDCLLLTHKSYLSSVLPLIEENLINGVSHITGGGIIENTERVISENNNIIIDWNSWEVPFIFDLIKKEGLVPDEDMRRSFNMGIGMILIVNEKNIAEVENHIKSKDQKSCLIGEIV